MLFLRIQQNGDFLPKMLRKALICAQNFGDDYLSFFSQIRSKSKKAASLNLLLYPLPVLINLSSFSRHGVFDHDLGDRFGFDSPPVPKALKTSASFKISRSKSRSSYDLLDTKFVKKCGLLTTNTLQYEHKRVGQQLA